MGRTRPRARRACQGLSTHPARRAMRRGHDPERTRLQDHFGRFAHRGAPRPVGEVARAEVPRHGAEARRGRRRRPRLALHGRQDPRAARARHLRRHAARGPQVDRRPVRLDHPPGLLRRRRRRDALPAAACDAHLYEEPRSRRAPRRHPRLQPLAARGVLRAGSRSADRHLPDPQRRHRDGGGRARAGKEGGLPRRRPLCVAIGRRQPPSRGRPLLGRRRRARHARLDPPPARRAAAEARGVQQGQRGDRRLGVHVHDADPRRDDLPGRVRPLPEAQARAGRGGRRLDPPLLGDGRRPLLAQPALDQDQREEGAERVLPRPLPRHLHRRPRGHHRPPPGRRREHGVVDRLPAPRQRLAVLAAHDRRAVRRRAGGGAPQDRVHERRALLGPRLTRPRPSRFRLAPDVRPSEYDLHLTPDLEAGRFTGRVRITVRLARPTAAITLHAADLRITRAAAEAGGAVIGARATLLRADEAVRLRFARPLPAGEAVLALEFAGTLNQHLRGLYAASAGGRRYAFTQCEAADARRILPCFDEPSFKARFRVSVTARAGDTVLSNSPVEREEPGPDGTRTVRFAPTPPLSTYLLALAVGPLEASPARLLGSVPIRVWHVPGKGALAGFGLEAGYEALRRLEEYFGTPYPYAKLDLGQCRTSRRARWRTRARCSS